MRSIRRFASIIFAVYLSIPLGADAKAPSFDYVVRTPPEYGYVYGIGSTGGVWVSDDNGTSWIDRSAGLPVRVVYPFDGTEVRRVESLSYDPLYPERISIATVDKLFVSIDTGANWNEIPTGRPIKGVDHFTAVCVSPHDPDTILAGTSFGGYYESSDGGVSWVSQKSAIEHLYYGAGFYETITAIAVSPVSPNTIYLSAGLEGVVYRSEDGGKSWRPIGSPTIGAVNAITFAKEPERDSWLLHIQSMEGVWVYIPGGEVWRLEKSFESYEATRQPAAAKNLRRQIAANRSGIYVNPSRASGEAFEKHLDLLAEHGMDSIVVDMKDDTGRLTYDTELPLPGDVGAVDIRFSLDEMLGLAHDAGVYVIGRIVVFQDPKLYVFDENRYASRNSETGKPWGNMIRVSGSEVENDAVYEQREYWVDPHSEFVWRYNIEIAAELEARGIDEVQFDYIRFPSDGDTSIIDYRFAREGMTRADAIESFLKLARENIRIPISTDLYGFNAWYPMGGWIGQNIDVVADYVDVVCPMFYPSHFPGNFLSNLDFMERAEVIYATGSNRAAAITGERCVIRPYVQAFLIGSERKFETDTYTEYLTRQLDGVVGSLASGFTLWNASNIYYMITRPLERYTGH